MRRILFDILILIVVIIIVVLVYYNYQEQILRVFIGDQPSKMYVESTPISVIIADDPAEHMRGLSGVEKLDEFQGMLFVFPQEDHYGMWMKDMLFPIDILWINNESRIVHIEENISPDTYPETFVSDHPARFVLETNAFFARNANVVEGDVVSLPPAALPTDLIELP